MKGTLTFICVVVVTVGMTLAAVPMGDWNTQLTSGIDATGGPDAYGYTWIDSNEPGGPVLDWIDIADPGNLVTGMGDDNWVGPFNIGFPFRYYWYDVDQFYIGSNGYLKFGDPFNMSQTFPASIPLATTPNDFVAVYLADFYPGQSGQGEVYQWTNNSDSLIVSFIDIPEWTTTPPAGSHTFQVILTDTDSSITFQYLSQSGTVSNNDILIGIENNNGQVGLMHSAETYAPSNYVVRYVYPPNTPYVVHDMATVASANENSEGFFILNGDAVSPWGRVKNVGNQTETTFQVRCMIEDESGTPVYFQATAAGPLAPGDELDLNFTPNWIPTANGQYFCNLQVTLAGDMNPSNDQKATEAHVLNLPGELLYDDGTSEEAWTWIGGDGGLAQRFVPPTYPVNLDQISLYLTSVSATDPFVAKVFDDDGPDGTPGTELYSESAFATTANTWHDLPLTPIEITEGAFYVSWHMTSENSPGMGTDNSVDQIGSRQSWEYTGVWAPYRNAETHDVMIRADISEPGAYPNFAVILTYVAGSPVPPSGGNLIFDAYFSNNSGASQDFDAWLAVEYEGGAPTTIVLRSFTNYQAGWAVNRPAMFFPVPGGYPAGNYTLNLRIGSEPNPVWAEDGFPFEKLGSSGDGSVFVPFVPGGMPDIFGEIDKSAGVLVPTEFATLEFYPNPFNPVTVASFSIPVTSYVNLAIYDVSGRQVAELVNGYRDAGSHEVNFDGSNLSSGVYVYHLTAGEFSGTGKMVLLK